MPMARAIQSDCAALLVRTCGALIHEAGRLRVRAFPAAAMIPTGSSAAACRTAQRFDRTKPHDGIERGLLGYFINSSIENQYEFVLGHWVNDSEFAGAVRLNPKSKDPMIGTQDPAESIFVIPQNNGETPIKVTGFGSFVTTRAAAYCFLPSITAMKFISNL